MQKYINTVQDTSGKAQPSVSVTVNVHLGGLATIYSDNGVTSIPNPLLTAADGTFFFYAANGRYDLVLAKAGLVFVNAETSDVVLFDPASSTTLVVATSVSAATVTASTVIAQADSTATAPAQMEVLGLSDSNRQLLIGYNTTSNYGSIQATRVGVNPQALVLNPSTGNVGVWTVIPRQTLDVLNANGTQLRLSNTDNGNVTDFKTDGNGNLNVTPSGSTWFFKGSNQHAVDTPSFGATVTIDQSAGFLHRINVTSGVTFTVATPVSSVTGDLLWMLVRTVSHPATASFAGIYKTAGFAIPTTGNSTATVFLNDGTNFIQLTPWTSGIPN